MFLAGDLLPVVGSSVLLVSRADTTTGSSAMDATTGISSMKVCQGRYYGGLSDSQRTSELKQSVFASTNLKPDIVDLQLQEG